VRGRQQHCGRGSHRRRAAGPLGESPHEQIGGQCGGEGEQRVHAAEAAVDAEQLRGRGNERGRDAGEPAGQAAAEVVTEDDRCESEENRNRPQCNDRRLDCESEMREEEMERCAAAVEHHGLDEVRKRLHRDQPGERLVLVDRLRRRVPYELDERVDERPSNGEGCCHGGHCG
jgi:hypothetical protein